MEFPLGFLPEEELPSTGGGGSGIDWPWSNGVPRGGIGRIQPASDPSARAELYQLEAALATHFGSANHETLPGRSGDEEASALLDEIVAWLGEFVSPEGLFVPDPWRTYSLVPPLRRIERVLGSDDPGSRIREVLSSFVQNTLRTAWWRGWLRGAAGPSRGYLELLAAIQVELLDRSWTTARRILWEKEKPPKTIRLPQGGIQSDHAAAAVLRRDWTVGGPVIAVDHRATTLDLECRIFGEAILAGPWRSRAWIDGREARIDGAWEPTCWFQDEDAEYLELKLAGSDGIIIERQIFLARKVALIWLSDTLTPAGAEPKADPRALELAWELTSPTVTALVGQLPTRAQKLVGPKFEARLIPVGLPASPLAVTTGTARAGAAAGAGPCLEGDKLNVRARVMGKRLFLPLALTWAARSLPAPAEWKALTITNDRRKVEREEAVAFRIPVADTQIVFFRALERATRYAFLGHQTYSECEIGELDRRGNFSEWLTISGSS